MAVNEDIEITIESEPSQFTELEVIPIYGPTGNGISRIEKTDTSYNVDTYTIYFTNGTTTTFTVTNGISILDIQKTDTTGLVDTYTISLSDGNTHTFTVTNGVGISNIAKTSTSGLVDTYTVTLNNSDSYTFTVTNGKAGTIEVGSVTTGAAGSSASVTNVGTDNEAILNFVIPKGEKGETGDTGTAATVTVGTTTTGEAGTQASVTNSGTSSAAVFNFTIPKGDKGDTGNTGATGNGISGTSLLSWEGLVKTYRMSYTNGSYFDYTVENGTGQVDWGGVTGVIDQQTDLQSALHYNNGYLNSGDVITDKILYNYVYGYNHSTFDLSKFTKVGSPIITDDGIASGFSTSNYINLDYSWATSVSDLTFRLKFHTNTLSSTKQFLIGYTSNGVACGLQITNENKIFWYAWKEGTGSDAAPADTITTTTTLNNNTDYTLVYGLSGNNYFLKLYDSNNTLLENLSVPKNTNLPFDIASRFRLGVNGQYYPADALINASLDLKNFSITVNGYPVFSGNKTGIDTIKPADYTVVGTPTISAEGIASGFSSSDYIQTNFTYNDFVTKFNFIWNGTNPSASSFIYKIQTANNFEAINIYQKTNGYLDVIARVSNTSYYDFTNFAISANVPVLIEIVKTSTSLTINAIQNGTSIYSKTVTTHIPTFDSGSFMQIGKDTVQGSIDLNSIKIYANGNLVYQPCLLIPYNESSTGSKIVDVAYRDRVIDVYEQYGSANYYTIDETNKNVTLPMGELYGLIGQRTLRASYRNGINYWEEYSDRTLEQGGSCTSGTTVNLLKPFADTNYVLTVPYSAKTTTSFTPSASGDWIAKGLGE